MIYPDKYPTGPYESERQACWDFLCLNQTKATEAVVQFMNSEFKRVGYIAMARGQKKKAVANGSEKAEWSGFANIDLTADDKAAINGGILDGEAVLEIMTEMLTEGHKISLSYDMQRDTVSCSVTGAYKMSKNAGLTCTSFARDVTTALLVMAYKHEVVAKGDWRPFVRESRPKEDFG